MAEVELRDVTRQFQGMLAVDSLSLRISSGEFVVLVGPSGCGKSTALRMIAGLDHPDGGSVLIGGKSMASVAPQHRDVAMVFQGYALYPHMKVLDIISFPLKMRKVPKADRERKALDAAKLLGIEKLLDRRPSELSGGERQRVAMGRALVRHPKVFLFDEPLSNLDAALRAEIRVEIGALAHTLGTTTIYVTHDHVEAMTLGHRIAVMREGRLEQVGSPKQVYERPATAFVAGFLGSPAMNLRAARRDGGWIVSDGIRLRLGSDAPRDEKLLWGVRPEHIRLGGEPLPGSVLVQANVVAVEPLGAETFVHLDVEGSMLRARLPGLDAPHRGERVDAHFAPAHIHFFQADGAQKRLEYSVEAA